MSRLLDIIGSSNSIALIGHDRPDLDCYGSVIGLYYYIKDNYINKTVNVFIDEVDNTNNWDMINTEEQDSYDTLIILDCSSDVRAASFNRIKEKSSITVCIDHHRTNTSFCDINIVEPTISSTSELLFTQLDKDYITPIVAELIYKGIMGDTGRLKYNTTNQTLSIAAECVRIADINCELFGENYDKVSYSTLQIKSEAVRLSKFLDDDKKIISSTLDELIILKYVDNLEDAIYGGIAEELRNIDTVEVSILVRPYKDNIYIVSLRSTLRSGIDVSSIAQDLGGGGHKCASSFTIDISKNTIDNVINTIKEKIQQTPEYQALIKGDING